MPAAGWHERWLGLRDRLLANPRFQRWAAGFPLTRPIARRRARALFDLCAGFVYSQVLLACVRTGLFEALAEGARPAERLPALLGLPAEETDRLLRAAAALALVERRPGARWGLGPLGAAAVGNPAIARMVEHHALLYADLADPVALLARRHGGTALARYWAYAGRARPDGLADADVAAYSALMAQSQALVAGEVLDSYPLSRHRRLLDVGGGEGAFALAAAARAPQLALHLFDLPAVAARASARFAAAGFAGRATATGGDFRRDALPAGADIVTLVRVLHDHDDDAALALLRTVRRALPAGGTLLVAEPMAGTPGAEPVGDAYFGFYLLAMGSGRPRAPQELAVLLRQAGFGRLRLLANRTPMLVRILTARATGQADNVDVNFY